MGTGKTLIGLLCAYHIWHVEFVKSPESRTVLVVVPLGTLASWKNECKALLQSIPETHRNLFGMIFHVILLHAVL